MLKLLADEPKFEPVPHISLRLPFSSAKANKPIQILADRTLYLKNELEKLSVGVGGGGIHFIGTLDDQEALDSIDTTNLPDGSAYFVGATVAVWNLAKWVVSGSIQGKPGEGIEELNALDLLNVYQTTRG